MKNKTKKLCLECKNSFDKPKKYSKRQWKLAKFCSLSCKGKYFARKNLEDPSYKDFLRKIATGRKQSLQTKIKRGIYKKGKESHSWKRGYSIDKKSGYIKDSLTKKRMHRLIMEKELGRILLDSEVVHHINGDKLDNSISNLMVMSKSQHIKEHDPLSFRYGKPTWD